MKELAFLLCALSCLQFVQCMPEQGVFSGSLTQEYNGAAFVKTLYNGSTIKLVVKKEFCESESESYVLQWAIRSSSCYGELLSVNKLSEPASRYIDYPSMKFQNGGSGMYLTNGEGDHFACSEQAIVLRDRSSVTWIPYSGPESKQNETKKSVKKRSDDETKEAEKSDISDHVEVSTAKMSVTHLIAIVPIDAPYLIAVRIKGKGNFSYSIQLKMKTPLGHLSAHDYPLLTFYMVMCVVYVLYAVAWLIMSACNFRDLLRVQFWIGGVILLGMIEKAVFYSDYLSVNSTGISVTGAAKFAEIVSALKRSLARMLVIIVSLGFGIVKPRLGPMLHRVIGIGVLYFILAVIEAFVRTDAIGHDPNTSNLYFASIPLAVLDSIICWWIFMSLLQTMKTLRLRRNVVKLSLYRHFSNTIIFCVIASFIMIIWSSRNRDVCLTNWRELWVEDAFWHVLFSVILLVIMILWRPNVNNQRYAFSPLIDGAEEEELAEAMLGAGATETMKMRGMKNAADNSKLNKAEEDLKWIEENIPQTVADVALPAILDSDEEVMTTKYEMSKME